MKKKSNKTFISNLLTYAMVIIAFVVVFMNYLADVVTQYVDPRVRLD